MKFYLADTPHRRNAQHFGGWLWTVTFHFMIRWQSHFSGPFLHNKILCFHLCWNTLYWERQNRTWFYKFFEIIFWSVKKHKKRCQDFSWHRSDCANFVSTGHKVSSSHQYSWLCDCNIAITKLNVVSVSDIIKNKAVFLSPILSSSNSS